MYLRNLYTFFAVLSLVISSLGTTGCSTSAGGGDEIGAPGQRRLARSNATNYPSPKTADGKAPSKAQPSPEEKDKKKDLADRPNREAYDRIYENPFLTVHNQPLSTFSIDVDTASYANVRRFLLRQGTLPPPGAVRIEELVNYFDYQYPSPDGKVPFSTNIDLTSCPWTPGHRLVRIGLQGKKIDLSKRPSSNLVFLMDVSGSMFSRDKLPLLKKSFKLLVEKLGENDRVAIVVYAGASGLVLPSTTGDNKQTILQAIDRLRAGGSTNGGAGIQLAYQIAQENYIQGGVNRVILATDGDFNVGTTNRSELIRLIEKKAKSGVFLTVLGFGRGNYQEATMEELSNKGNGNFAYIDSIKEARKVMVNEMGGTLITIAKDVKIQVEFNPLLVSSYRLIGYENRMLRNQDFDDDTKDAGEIGAGHRVTALYEIVPVGSEKKFPKVNKLKYQKPGDLTEAAKRGELLTVKLRYKQPEGQKSRLLVHPVKDKGHTLDQASADFKFAAAVAAFGMLLRKSKHKGSADYDMVLQLAQQGRGKDRHGYRAEFIEMVKKAQSLGTR